MKKKILALFLVCAMALGSALPALAAEGTQPCEHIGMSIDGSYCNDCGTHYIMQQPSDDAYYVSVYDIENVESYQWYGYAEHKLVTDKDAYVYGNEYGKLSTYEGGVWTAQTRSEEETQYTVAPFTMKLEPSDILLINAYAVYGDGYVEKLSYGEDFIPFGGNFDSLSGSYEGYSAALTANGGDAEEFTPVIIAPKKTESYEIKVIAYHYDYSEYAELEGSVSDRKLLFTPVEGQTDYKLTDGENGKSYFCRVTFKDGAVIDTSELKFAHGLLRTPEPQNPTVEATAAENATYQWYREGYDAKNISEGYETYSYTVTPTVITPPSDISDPTYYYTYANVYLFKGTQVILTDKSVTNLTVSGEWTTYTTAGIHYIDVRESGYYYIYLADTYKDNPYITLLCTKDEAEVLPAPFSYEKGKGWAPVELDEEITSELIRKNSPALKMDYGYVPTALTAFFGINILTSSLEIEYTGELDVNKFIILAGSDYYTRPDIHWNSGKANITFPLSGYDGQYVLAYADKVGEDVYVNAKDNGIPIAPAEIYYSEELGWQSSLTEYSYGSSSADIFAGKLKGGEYYLISGEGATVSLSPSAGVSYILEATPGSITDYYVYASIDALLTVSLYGYGEPIGFKLYRISPEFWHPADENPRDYMTIDYITGYEIIEEIKPVQENDTREKMTVQPYDGDAFMEYTEGKGYKITPNVDNYFVATVPAGEMLEFDTVIGQTSVSFVENVFYSDLEIDTTDRKTVIRNNSIRDISVLFSAHSDYSATHLGARRVTPTREKLEAETGATFTGKPEEGYDYFVQVCFDGVNYEKAYINRYFGIPEANVNDDYYAYVTDKESGAPMDGDYEYRWFEYGEGVELTPENASPYVDPDGKSSYYNSLSGWVAVNLSYASYELDGRVFTASLKKNDLVVLGELDNNAISYSSTTFLLKDGKGNEASFITDYDHETNTYKLYTVIPADGEYTLQLRQMNPNINNAYRIRATLYSAAEASVLKGSDTAYLKNAKHGHYYRVDVNLLNGVTVSAPTYFENGIIDVDIETPKVILRSEAGVEFNWYRHEQIGSADASGIFSPIVYGENRSDYSTDYRIWSAVENTVGGTVRYEYFKIAAKKGDVLVLSNYGTLGIDEITVLDASGEAVNISFTLNSDMNYELRFTEDGEYIIASSDSGSIDANIIRNTLIEGETTSTLRSGELENYYFCTFSFGEGHEDSSDLIYIDGSILNDPTVYDPTVVTNNKDVSYQWRVEDSTEITDELATPFTVGEASSIYENGEWTGVFTEDGEYILYFSKKLNRGDTLVISSDIDVMYGIGEDFSQYRVADISYLSGVAYATIIESGVYSFVIGKDFAAGTNPTISIKYELSAIEGETEATLKSELVHDGRRYDVLVVFGNGTTHNVYFETGSSEPAELVKQVYKALQLDLDSITSADKDAVTELYEALLPYVNAQLSITDGSDFANAYDLVTKALAKINRLAAKVAAISGGFGAFNLDSVNENDLAAIDAIIDDMDWIEHRLSEDEQGTLATLRETASQLRAKAAATPAPDGGNTSDGGEGGSTPEGGEGGSTPEGGNTPEGGEGESTPDGGNTPEGGNTSNAPEGGESESSEEAPEDKGGLGAGAVIAIAAGAAVVGAGAGVGITFGVSAAKKAPKAKKPEGTEE